MADSRSQLAGARLALLDYHRALIQEARRHYEAEEGAASPLQFLQQLTSAEGLAWLKPLTAAILQIDEALDDEAAPAADLKGCLELLRDTLALGSLPFGDRARALEEVSPALREQRVNVLAALS